MTEQNFGDLSGRITSQIGFLSTLVPGFRQNTYQFDIAFSAFASPTQTRNISLYLHDITSGSDIDIDLYADSNNNGRLDASDQLVAYSTNAGSTSETIDYSATAGTYFAEVTPYSFGVNTVLSSYMLDASATYDVGALGTSTISRGRFNVSATDPADVFEFSIVQATDINLNLHNINRGDADLWLYQDTNANGIFDTEDELVDLSVQDGYGLEESITYSAEADTYFAEVTRYDGDSASVSYDLDFSIVQPATTPDLTPSVSAPATFRPFDPSQVLVLSSNPTANHTIYLDFNGHTTFGTSWNNRHNATGSFETAAYDTDDDTSTFSASELSDIWETWQSVAEDFSPFDINVTTLLPSQNQLTKTGAFDTQWGIRVVVGGDGDWLGSDSDSLLGIASPSLDSFNDSTDTPVFVFSDNHSDGYTVAQTISHEVGHSLGLSHDDYAGFDSNGMFVGGEYYSGNSLWAPTMGNGDFAQLSQWDRGEYSSALNREDDLDIITGQNGFGYRDDDHSDYFARASELAIIGNAVETYGIIETNRDFDLFSFDSATGNIDLEINAFTQGPNLDILAELYNANRQLLGVSNPADSLGASFAADLAPGTYYVAITGAGQGDPLTGGYSDYGSLGQYSITGAIA